MKQSHYKLMVVTNRGYTPLPDYLHFIRTCAVSGITAVQLREKNAAPEFLLEFGFKLLEILTPLKIPLIINDHTNLAVQLGADGVHLGQGDGDLNQARRVLGKDKTIGLSIGTLEELYQAYQLPVTYVAASAVFATKNKQNLKTLWGLSGLSHLVQHAKHPVIAIGGITTQNARHVMETGVAGIAVIGALHEAKNPAETTRTLRQMIDHYA